MVAGLSLLRKRLALRGCESVTALPVPRPAGAFGSLLMTIDRSVDVVGSTLP